MSNKVQFVIPFVAAFGLIAGCTQGTKPVENPAVPASDQSESISSQAEPAAQPAIPLAPVSPPIVEPEPLSKSDLVESVEAAVKPLGVNISGFGSTMMVKPEAIGEDGLLKPDVMEQLKRLDHPEIQCEFSDYLTGDSLTDSLMAQICSLPGITQISVDPKHLSNASTDCLAAAHQVTKIQLVTSKPCQITDVGLAKLAELPNLQILVVGFDSLDGSFLAALSGHPELEQLGVRGSDNISDADWAKLESLPKLKKFSFSGQDQVTGEGFTFLKGSPELRDVSFYSESLSDTALAYLEPASELRLLTIDGGNGITDKGVASLAKLTNLSQLFLTNSENVTDAGIAQLGGLTNLRAVMLDSAQITSASYETLAKFTKLTQLHMLTSGISDEGIDRLGALQELRLFETRNTKVTEEGANQLKALIPELTISVGEL